jgi:hypothetical protein
MAEQAKEEWGEVTGRYVERLRARKIAPIPPSIVAAAQASLDGKPDPKHEGKLLHVMTHEFSTVERAADFFRLVKKAGEHTSPPCSVSAVINPDPEGKFGNPTTDKDVSWKAGARRGRQ